MRFGAIMDATGQLLPAGQTGEGVIRGDNVEKVSPREGAALTLA